MNADKIEGNHEISTLTLSGWGMLALEIIMLSGALGLFILSAAVAQPDGLRTVEIIAGMVLFIVSAIFTAGFFTLQPNVACALVLFGAYRGTERRDGFHWTQSFRSQAQVVPTRAQPHRR